MNLEHVYGSAVMAIVMFLVCEACLYVVIRADGFSLPIGWMSRKKYILCAVLACILSESIWLSAAMGVIVGGLLFACVTDSVQCQVYHFVWWIVGVVLMLCFLFATWNHTNIPWLEITVFGFIQEVGFSKLYGKADSHAFCVCAMVFALCGKGMLWYLLHMALSLFLLGYVQWNKNNISYKGNLKKPVPFIPYIVVSFVMMYALMD